MAAIETHSFGPVTPAARDPKRTSFRLRESGHNSVAIRPRRTNIIPITL